MLIDAECRRSRHADRIKKRNLERSMNTNRGILGALILISILTFGCGKARDTRTELLKQEVQRKQQLLEQKQEQLEEAKGRQSILQKLFNESEEVDLLEADIKALKDGIKASRKEIRNLESGYSGGMKKAVLAGFWTTLIFMIIIALVSQGVLVGQGEAAIILSEFFIFWLVFSIAIKFIFY